MIKQFEYSISSQGLQWNTTFLWFVS